MSEPTWVPVPQSLEYDLITHAIQHGEIPREYRICRLVDAPDAPQADWRGAPQWAMFWTVNGTGSIYWWELEPLRSDFSFEWSKMVGKFEYGGDIEVPLGVDWRTLKRKRPAPAERSE